MSTSREKALSRIVQCDQRGAFIEHRGRKFRPDPNRLKKTEINDMMNQVCHSENPGVGREALLLNYIAPVQGEKVSITDSAVDESTIGAPMKVDQKSAYFDLHPQCHLTEQNVTWSEETTSFRRAFN